MNTNSKNEMTQIAEQFALEGTLSDIRPFGNGHINDTFLVTSKSGDREILYILQKINQDVFHHPEQVMENSVRLTDYLAREIALAGGDPDRETMHFVTTRDGQAGYRDQQDRYWRVSCFIENSVCYERADEQLFYESARTFGHFQYLLQNYPADTLYETIPNFHNTISRFADFKKAVEEDQAGRIREVWSDIQFLLDREYLAHKLLDLLADGRLPLRVTHNDTKLNNILFDQETGKAICVIDLDTVMPGLSAYDFGDSIRFGAITAAEDEPDLDKVHFDYKLFQIYAKGFIEGCKGSLTMLEQELLPYGAICITYEQALRFLGDYLNGDVYYKVSRPGQNLDRTRTQIRMVEEMEKMVQEMTAYTTNLI